MDKSGIALASPLTTEAVSATPSRVGRNAFVAEQTLARFREGTLARIRAVLGPGEKQSDLIRSAVERELARREAAKDRPLTARSRTPSPKP